MHFGVQLHYSTVLPYHLPFLKLQNVHKCVNFTNFIQNYVRFMQTYSSIFATLNCFDLHSKIIYSFRQTINYIWNTLGF